MVRDFEQNSEDASEIKDFKIDEFDSGSVNRVESKVPEQNSAPPKNDGFQTPDRPEITQRGRLNIGGLKRINIGEQNELISDNGRSVTSLEDNWASQDLRKKKLLEMTRRMEMNARRGIYRRREDDPWLNRDRHGRWIESNSNIRKVHIQMRPFLNSGDEEDHVISELNKLSGSRSRRRPAMIRDSRGAQLGGRR